MIIFYEVVENIEVDGETIPNELAAVDVSGMGDAEKASVLADLKTLYGESCIYQRHSCGHNEGLPCTMEVI